MLFFAWQAWALARDTSPFGQPRANDHTHTHTHNTTQNTTGPAEELIGAFYRAHPERAPPATQACTKICFFDAREMATVSAASVKRAVDRR